MKEKTYSLPVLERFPEYRTTWAIHGDGRAWLVIGPTACVDTKLARAIALDILLKCEEADSELRRKKKRK